MGLQKRSYLGELPAAVYRLDSDHNSPAVAEVGALHLAARAHLLQSL